MKLYALRPTTTFIGGFKPHVAYELGKARNSDEIQILSRLFYLRDPKDYSKPDRINSHDKFSFSNLCSAIYLKHRKRKWQSFLAFDNPFRLRFLSLLI